MLLVIGIDDILIGLGVSILVAGAVAVGQMLLQKPPRFDNARPAGLGDFQFPTTTEGRVIPIVWGTVRLNAPNVVWYGNLLAYPITKEVKYNLLKSTTVTTGYQYYMGLQLGLCRGVVDLRAMFWGDTKVWDATATPLDATGPVPFARLDGFATLLGGDSLGTGGIGGDVDFLNGDQDQPVDPYVANFNQASAGTTRTPNYGGTAYVVLKDFYVGNSTSIKAAAFEVRRIPNPLGLPDEQAALNGGNDANPANVLYELVTDDEAGGAPPALVDLDSFRAAAAVLAAEGNGFSFVMDRAGTVQDVQDAVERQIGGFVYEDPATGLLRVRLLRADYDPATLVEVKKATDDAGPGNLVEVVSFVPASWKNTTNYLTVMFFDRAKNYEESPAPAQDLANQKIQGEGLASGTAAVVQQTTYGGVKDAALAAQLAWRDLRLASFPRAAASLVVTRALWGLLPGDVFALTDPSLRVTKLPMRVVRVEEGDVTDGTLRVDCVQDAYATYPASGGAPPASLWANPATTLAPFTRFFVFEAPNAFNTRNPDHLTPLQTEQHVIAGATQNGGAVGFFVELNGVDSFGNPDDSFDDFAKGESLTFSGTLKAALIQGQATGSDITLATISRLVQQAIIGSCTSDSNEILIGRKFYTSEPFIHVCGRELFHVLLIDDELILFESIEAGDGTDVVLRNCFRGALDTVQPLAHAAGAQAYFVIGIAAPNNGYSIGSVSTAGDLEAGPQTYDVRLEPFSNTARLNHADVTPTRLALTKRAHRPPAPGELYVDDVPSGQVAHLEYTGTLDGQGFLFRANRRDARIADLSGPHDEAAAIQFDALAFFPDYPINNTRLTVSVYFDPFGVNALLFTLAPAIGPTFTIQRNDVLRRTNGVLPTTLAVHVHVTHDYQGTNYGSQFDTHWAVLVSSNELGGRFPFGAIDGSGTGHGNPELSNVYTADSNGVHTFSIYTIASGTVQYSKNGGAWTNLIIGGVGTSGTVSLAIGETIQLRHFFITVGQQRLVLMTAPGGTNGFMLAYKT